MHFDWTFRVSDLTAVLVPLALWAIRLGHNWVKNFHSRLDNIEDAVDDVLTVMADSAQTYPTYEARTRFRRRRRELNEGKVEHKFNGRAN